MPAVRFVAPTNEEDAINQEAGIWVVIGADAHKKTHTFVAVDGLGRKLGEKTVSATTEGHVEALAWTNRWAARRWALEDCRHLTPLLESDLLAAGETVIRVPPHLVAESRRSGREQGKSDPIDALAVVRAALREPNLPMAKLEGDTRQLRLLVDHREDLVAERTRMFSRLRWHLHELFPGYHVPSRGLRRFHILAELQQRLEGMDGLVAEIACELVVRCHDLTTRVNQLERHIWQGRTPDRADAPRAARLWPTHSGQDHRRNRRGRSFSL